MDESIEKSLPKIAAANRIIPNDLIRSSLFNVVNHSIKREFIKDTILFSFGKTEITYRGEELRQDDEDVLLQLIFFASSTDQPFVSFMPYQFIGAVGWPTRPHYKAKLKECLNRLTATDISIYRKDSNGFSFSLVRKFSFKDSDNEPMKKWEVWLEPEMLQLFEKNTYSKISWEERKKLKPLGKWLHAYYTSHLEPFPIKVSTIHKACGSKTKELFQFRHTLRRALLSLVQVGFLLNYWIDANDVVHVSRTKQKTYIEHESNE